MLRPIQQGRWSVDSAIRPKFVSLRLLLLLLLVVVVVLLLLLLILMMLLILLLLINVTDVDYSYEPPNCCDLQFRLPRRGSVLSERRPQPSAAAAGPGIWMHMLLGGHRRKAMSNEGCGRPGHRHHIHNQGAAV